MVIHHATSPSFQSPYVLPIQAGSHGRDSLEGTVRDDSGVNISRLNHHMYDLTAVYWYLHNVPLPDVVGFGQYRRVLDFSYGLFKFPLEAHRAVGSMRIEKYQSQVNFHSIYHEKSMEMIAKFVIENNVVIVSAEQFLHCSIYRHYAREHHESDMIAVANILENKSRGEGLEFLNYMHSNSSLVIANLSYMPKAIFQEYWNWALPVLQQLESEATYIGNAYQDRGASFMSERIMTYYLHTRGFNLAYAPYIFMPDWGVNEGVDMNGQPLHAVRTSS